MLLLCMGIVWALSRMALFKMADNHGEALGSRTRRMTAVQLMNSFMDDADSENYRFDIHCRR